MITSLCLTTLFGILFLYSAGSKALRAKDIAWQFPGRRRLGRKGSVLVVWLLVGVEGVTGASLLWGFQEPWVRLAPLGLLGIFTVYVIGVLRSGRTTSCLCFGADSEVISNVTLWRNGLLILLYVPTLLLPVPTESLDVFVRGLARGYGAIAMFLLLGLYSQIAQWRRIAQ